MKLFNYYLKQSILSSLLVSQSLALLFLGLTWWEKGSAEAVKYIKTNYIGDPWVGEGWVFWMTALCLASGLICATIMAPLHYLFDLDPIPSRKRSTRTAKGRAR